MLLASTSEKQDQLVDYVFKVLDVYGLKYGPRHSEVISAAKIPILMEVCFRYVPPLCHHAFAVSCRAALTVHVPPRCRDAYAVSSCRAALTAHMPLLCR